jgi:hypothetical protein
MATLSINATAAGLSEGHQRAPADDRVEHGERRHAGLSHQGHRLSGSDAAGDEFDGGEAPSMEPASLEVQGLPERPDGNNVNIDRESLMLSQTQLQYQMGVQLDQGEFTSC